MHTERGGGVGVGVARNCPYRFDPANFPRSHETLENRFFIRERRATRRYESLIKICTGHPTGRNFTARGSFFLVVVLDRLAAVALGQILVKMKFLSDFYHVH